jgi:hypothetical protein
VCLANLAGDPADGLAARRIGLRQDGRVCGACETLRQCVPSGRGQMNGQIRQSRLGSTALPLSPVHLARRSPPLLKRPRRCEPSRPRFPCDPTASGRRGCEA